MMIRIRPATPADAAAIAQVHVDSWRTTYAGIVPAEHLAKLSYGRREEIWRGLLTSAEEPTFTFVAEDDGTIVGFASGGPERSGDPVYRGELTAIYLLASHQSQGIGRRLTSAVAERLLKSGLDSMVIWVLAANPACRFYESLGGIPVYEKQITIGGAELPEVAYGWVDVRPLAAEAR